MVYETSYESGRRPFRPDTTRGYWAKPTDFIYACLGLTFKMDLLLPFWIYFYDLGIYSIVPYIICLTLFVVPIIIIQGFIGQFSSSGFLSAFRITPLFKGMGYVSLALNFTTLTYYTIFATVPMFFLFNSFRPTMPWSCEALPDLIRNTSREDLPHTCTDITLENSTTEENGTSYDDDYYAMTVPSVFYFKSTLRENRTIAWQLVICNFLTWLIMAGIFYKYFNTEKLGKLLRYLMWTVLALLFVNFCFFLSLPGAYNGLLYYVQPSFLDPRLIFPAVPIFVATTFGPGWGSLVTMFSFNKFKTNINRYTWIICFGQMAIFIFFGLILLFIEQHFAEITGQNFSGGRTQHWELFLSSASAIANAKFSNLWSIIFFLTLVLIAFALMIPHLYALLVSVFDEFETLRDHKTKFTMTLIGLISLISICFCSYDGVTESSALTADTIFTQTALNLLLLLVVLWIYGRQRFQRDFEFMVSQPFSTWKITMLRFAAPLCLFFVLAFSFIGGFILHLFSSWTLLVIAGLLIVLPWIFIPGYAIVSLLQTTGTFWLRFKRCCRPHDWYPVETEDRQNYEEAMGNMDITHQLSEMQPE